MNRYQAGFNSVIIYNLDDKKVEIQYKINLNFFFILFSLRSVMDLGICSCILSFISHPPIHCAQHVRKFDAQIHESDRNH